MSQQMQQGFGAATGGPGGFPPAPPLSRDNPGRLIPARAGFLPGALPGRGASPANAHMPMNKETALAGSAPVQMGELHNGLPFGGNAPGLAGGLPFAPSPPAAPKAIEEATIMDAVLPFAQPAAAAVPPLFGASKPGAIEPPPRILTPPPGAIAMPQTVEVRAPVQMKSEPPPGFAPVAPPLVGTNDVPPPALVTPPAIIAAPPPLAPSLDLAPPAEEKMAKPAEGDSPWLHEPPPPPTLTTPARESEPPVVAAPAKTSSKTPIFAGIAVVLLGALAFVGYTFRDRIVPPASSKDAASAEPVTTKPPAKTAAPVATETAKAAPPPAVTSEATSPPAASSPPAPSAPPTQQPTEQPTAHPVAPPPQVPAYHPPPRPPTNPGTTQPGGKFDPGGI